MHPSHREELAGRGGAVKLVHGVNEAKLGRTERSLVKHALSNGRDGDVRERGQKKCKQRVVSKEFMS